MREPLMLKRRAARWTCVAQLSFHRILPAGGVARDGMRASPNERPRTRVSPARIGRVSQATKNAQAARDTRNSG